MSELEISTDRARQDVDAIHAYLARSYWAEGITRERVAHPVDCARLRLAARSASLRLRAPREGGLALRRGVVHERDREDPDLSELSAGKAGRARGHRGTSARGPMSASEVASEARSEPQVSVVIREGAPP